MLASPRIILPVLCRNLRYARSSSRLPFLNTSTSLSSTSPHRRLSNIPANDISHVIGKSHPPLFQQTLGSFFDDLVSKHPQNPAIIVRHEQGNFSKDCIRWSFSELDDHVDRLAHSLHVMGIRKGDRVGAFMLNSSSYATLQWATAKIGAIMACINPACGINELLDILNMIECKALFCVPTIRKSDYASMLLKSIPSLAEPLPNRINAPEVPSLRSIILFNNLSKYPKNTDFASVLSRGKSFTDYSHLIREKLSSEQKTIVRSLTKQTNQHECINMQFTSGTTGRPKAVALTHHNLLNNGFFIGENMKLTSNDVLCNPPPLFHCFGLVLGNLAAWTHGGCIVYASQTFDPVAVLRTVSEEKCTALHGVPTMFIAELALLDKLEAGEHVEGLSGLKLDFSSLRTGIAAGSPVPDEIMRKVMNRLNLAQLTIAYGMTETSPVTFMTKTDDPLTKRTETVGQVQPHVEAKICDPLDPFGPPLPVNSPGELLVSGYPLQLGYWNNKEETDKVMIHDKDGVRWMRTGDAAILDQDGYLSIVGRYKDIIIRGGENLFPVSIENQILTLEGVADAAVIAVEDKVFGEVVGVFIQRKESELGTALSRDAICKHVAQSMPQSKPAWIWFLGEEGVESVFPKTLSGKIRKVDLRVWGDELSKMKIGMTSIYSV